MNLSRGQLTMIVVLLCGALLVVLNSTLLSSVLPTLMVQFGVSATTVQWLTSGYAMAEAVTVPLSAYLVGRFSTRKLFFGGLGLFIVGSIAAAVAPIFPVLLIGRMLQGVAAGVVMPMTFSLILLIFPRESRGSAMGLVTLVVGFAPAIGPTLGGVVSDIVGWRFLFIGVTVVAVIIVAVGIKALTNFEGFDRYKLDVASVVLMAVGMITMLYGISSFSSSANVLIPIVMIIVGVALLAVFARRQMRLEAPMLKIEVLRSRRYRMAVIVVLILQASLVGSGVLLPLYMQNVLGYSATVTGLCMFPGAFFGAFMGLISGRLFDRYGVRGLTLLGATLIVVAGVGMVMFTTNSTIAYITLMNALLLIGIQTIITPINTWGVNSLDNRVIQHANSLQNSLNQVAASIGTAFLTSLTAFGAIVAPNASAFEQTFMGDHVAYCGLLALLAIDALIVLVCVRNKKGDEMAVSAGLPVESDEERAWTVAEVMDTAPKYVLKGQTVGDAFDLFAATETDGVPVVDENDQVVGYLSDGDVLNYLAQKESGFASGMADVFVLIDDEHIQQTMLTMFELDAMAIATKKVITLDADMPIERACKVFTDRKLKKAPVVRDGKLVGSLSRRNIVSFIAAKAQRSATSDKPAE